ncbi:LacI family transcriptional regulator [Microbacterium sp. EYE_5]|uniref:LacI family DNA-binding transcriptional regulator n=1 Tax=unclassified Microbacterium TaxID=2609290 RepID=UPI0020037922|nr:MULTISPECIES: LacI family DNA-binding transcriptional regulator [unclassified Microbacterium]MCK6080155.1 LacI family transcriptional regulator [Microbacterium sp. EYE_382]MCK6085426.1 LacI family transcriptional regulator [Microbacterium sp. EYE_384]MCK6122349.1 LacI family transcriptional regulator [Microbacterium sp. EYE_80]MCK6126189.1 LacI family transcriptional regulator [Microbacterium sp. EYE_79]MCK6141110.1 LacI family transcriptional regulator [Microbacterium sp. EYE_39]
MSPTLHDVARVAGVSIKTVSNVINDHPHVRPATREKVERAIADLGYTPNLTARNLRSGRAGAIALAVPDLALSYFAELAGLVIAEAERRGVVVLVEQTGGDRDRELDLLRSPRRGLTDGLIFSPLGMGQEDAERLRVPYPMVLLGERVFDGPVDHVTMRNVEAARSATEHLIAAGRRRVAVIGAHDGEVIGSAGLRLRGYREALEAAGIPFDPALVGSTTMWHRANGARTMHDVLDRGVDFDAVLGLNDTLALGAMRVLQESGRRVPEDVAVVGFDDLDEAQYSIPSLTTVDPGQEWIARTAVETLLARVAAPGEPHEPALLLADFRLAVRESAPLA